MTAISTGRLPGLFRAWATLVWLSFRRLLWSAGTLTLAFPLLGGAALMGWWGMRMRTQEFEASFLRFSELFVTGIFTLVLLPVVALAYATSSIGGDREDKTLLFLLIRPVPRSMILLAKLTATMPLVLGIVTGCFFLYCYQAGPVGQEALRLYFPAVLAMAVAYVCLYHLFAVCFKHSTTIALIYSLFMESLLGNMPGITKRVAVNFFGRSIMYHTAEPWGFSAPQAFEAVSPATAFVVLACISIGSTLLAMFIFQRREYAEPA
ncbi:MAG: ABC transporter permease subunit [Planctomycetia bacterium]|nr:ABC transporter permease subunit [Planctomycetia bacterium]